MKVIIDPYRGGSDTGNYINGQYEKNILLNLSKTFQDDLAKLGISSELIRTNDISLTDDERNSIINEIKDSDDIIIQNRLSENNEFEIIYSLKYNDALASNIALNLEKNGIVVDKYYQRRLPSNTMLDYYSVIRNTVPNETIIIEYADLSDYEDIVKIIALSIKEYLDMENTYVVIAGDSLYKIANMYNTTVNELKELNNLVSNNLSIGQVLKLPKVENTSKDNDNLKYYTVVSGDTIVMGNNNYKL